MLSEENFTTELETGEEVPVRRVGDTYIVAYDHIEPKEFMYFASLLLSEEGADNDYDEDDVSWEEGVLVDFGEVDGVPKLRFNDPFNEEAIRITVLECW